MSLYFVLGTLGAVWGLVEHAQSSCRHFQLTSSLSFQISSTRIVHTTSPAWPPTGPPTVPPAAPHAGLPPLRWTHDCLS